MDATLVLVILAWCGNFSDNSRNNLEVMQCRVDNICCLQKIPQTTNDLFRMCLTKGPEKCGGSK